MDQQSDPDRQLCVDFIIGQFLNGIVEKEQMEQMLETLDLESPLGIKATADLIRACGLVKQEEHGG